MPDLQIRPATAADLPTINSIYYHYVLHSTCTYQTEPSTAEERATWFAAHGHDYPVTVGTRDGEVIAWGSISRFHVRAAYRPTVEDSVYIRHDLLGQGIGRQMLDDLIARAIALGYHSMMALISADQEPSIRLHTRAGFAKIGHLREVGRKFDRWLDVAYMQRML
ncbi:MAG TPA: GNAT family N-acetyltransferase [Humisphaera sp.]|jgi:phosphinothricin acetyltransferase|nr:GNAT family N-acetyltransferase [Humisphaera sp.]